MLLDHEIIDVDTHYTEPADLWTSRAPAKFKGQVMEVKHKADGAQAWFIGSHEIGKLGTSVIREDLSKAYGMWGLPTYDSMARASTYAPERMKVMDQYGVSHQVIYPNVIGFGCQVLMDITSDPELRLWHIQAYNDALIELQKEGKGRLLPQAAMPLWDIDASLKELERVRKAGLTGIAMSGNPHHFGQQSLAHSVWDRFWAACQDMNVPVNFHIGSGDWRGPLNEWWGEEKTFVYPDRKLNAPLLVYGTLMSILHNASDIMNLILSGMLEKFPKLKFVSVESGAGWLPFVIQALEYNWAEMAGAHGRENIKRDLREMFVDQIYCSFWFENKNLVDLYIKEFGDKNLMVETDFPHPTSLYPTDTAREHIKDTLGHHSKETQQNILYQNAAKLYGIDA